MNNYKEQIYNLRIEYRRKLNDIKTEISRIELEYEFRINEVYELCRRETGHKDSGGMFYFSCEYCGFCDP